MLYGTGSSLVLWDDLEEQDVEGDSLSCTQKPTQH